MKVLTEEEKKQHRLKKRRENYWKNVERERDRLKHWRIENKKKYLENEKKYRKTPMGRADMLITSYRKKDKKAGRGKGDLTPKWVVENILSKPCVHCGKTGWNVIGCNRLDNSKSHTMDNVEPCCKECNDRLANPPRKIDQIEPVTGEIIHTWNSIRECVNAGYGSVDRYCRRLAKRTIIYKGYIWKYPL